jgi:anti-anti-sigma factor
MTATLAPSRSSAELLVTAEGELDLSAAGTMDEVLDAACAQTPPRLVLDLTSVTFMDCAALRRVLAARERMQACGGDLVVRGASRRCRRLLVLTGLTELLDEPQPGVAV